MDVDVSKLDGRLFAFMGVIGLVTVAVLYIQYGFVALMLGSLTMGSGFMSGLIAMAWLRPWEQG